jgi:hypothetical protein
VRLGRFTSITEVYDWITQYFNDYDIDIQQVLNNYQTYETNLTEVTQVLNVNTAEVVAFVPDKHTEVTSVDGYAAHAELDLAWAVLRGAAGNEVNDSAATITVSIYASVTTNKWYRIGRAILLFDTSAIPSDAYIVSAYLRVYVVSWSNNLGSSMAVCVVSSSPASNVALAAADYAALGATPLSEPLLYDLTVVANYYDLKFNSAGLAAISKGGITKLGLRELKYDIKGAVPPWVSNMYDVLTINSADYTTTGARRPYLVVNYILPP